MSTRLKRPRGGDDLKDVNSCGPVGHAPDLTEPVDPCRATDAGDVTGDVTDPVEQAAMLRALDLVELRAHRRALLDEVGRVQRWQRVVRARTDLTVAAVLPPAPLGPPGLAPLAPCPTVAEPVVLVPGCTVALVRLRQEARVLARYEGQVRALLAAATAELVGRYALVPDDALAASPLAG